MPGGALGSSLPRLLRAPERSAVVRRRGGGAGRGTTHDGTPRSHPRSPQTRQRHGLLKRGGAVREGGAQADDDHDDGMQHDGLKPPVDAAERREGGRRREESSPPPALLARRLGRVWLVCDALS
eukprot:12441-Rhodomonas_salina.1